MPDGAAILTLHEQALAYAALGIHVFPCLPGAKEPACPNGFHDATVDPAQISRWWAGNPSFNIGWSPACSGHSVVDLDCKPGKPNGFRALEHLEATHGHFAPFPETRTIETPSGGQHRVVGGQLPSSISKVARGIDIRGGLIVGRELKHGGYGLLPPSSVGGKHYRWVSQAPVAPAPEWFAKLAETTAARTIPDRTAPAGVVADHPENVQIAQRKLAAMIKAGEVSHEEQDGNARLYQAACHCKNAGLSFAVAYDLLWAEFNLHCLPPWDDPDDATFLAPINSAYSREAVVFGRDAYVPDEEMFKAVLDTLGTAEANSQGEAKPTMDGSQGEAKPTMDGSQVDIAALFSRGNIESLRWVDEWAKWLNFGGQRWAKIATPLVWNGVAKITTVLATKTDKAHEKRALKSRSTIAGAEALAKGQLLAPLDAWDRDPWMLNTPGGIIDLRTGELRPTLAADMCTKMTAVAPGGACPRWRQFLGEVTQGDVELQSYLQRLIGYSLIGQVIEHVLVFLYGTGGNGKGVFLNTVATILGDYTATAPMESFTEAAGDRNTADMAMLQGARLVTAQETEANRPWAEAKIKALTGGDPITARFLYQNFSTYQPQFTLVVAGNHKPRLRTVDAAIRGRFHMVPFTAAIRGTPAEDKNLPEALKAEWPGILQWAIEGCLAWQHDGLKPPQAVCDTTADYLDRQDPLSEWLADCCIAGPLQTASISDLYASYAQHPSTEHAKGKLQFGDQLESHGFKRAKLTGGVRGIRGLGLQKGASDDNPLW